MLEIIIPKEELWDESKEEFILLKEETLLLEHSLLSLSKWESKWNKPFLSKAKEHRTKEESIDYIRCMTITPNVDPSIYNRLNNKHIKQINDYIDSPMTATHISKDKNQKGNRETITSELIYYWMISLNIPFECQTWHLNRLITLIEVCNIKNTPPKKMSRKSLMARNSALNAARRRSLNTKG